MHDKGREAGCRKAQAPDCLETIRERSVKGSLACRASRSGGRVPLVDFDGRRRRVQMDGACAGCHLWAMTLQGWVAGTVRQFFPTWSGSNSTAD